MTSEPQQEAPEHDEPNDAGFAGEPTTPTPQRGDDEESYGETIAVPAGDITGALMEAIDDGGERHPGEDEKHD
jgi:hypothetical protein